MKYFFLKYFPLSLVLVFSLLLMLSCSDSESPLSSDSNSELSNNGKLIIRMTDAPFPAGMVEAANVTITKIEIRNDSTEQSDGNPFTILTEKDTTLNLLDLTNGVTTQLADLEIDTGSYDLLRLFVSEASVTLSESVNSDQKTFNLKVPSGAQTGIKVFIEPSIEVEGGISTELLLDFDVSKSFVVQGNPNTPAGIKGFIFKPVIRAVNQSSAGRISGIVVRDSAGVALPNAEVWTTRADTTFSTTFTDSTGFYSLIGLPEGSYNLNSTKANFDTTTVTNVNVTAGNQTNVDLTLTKQ